MLNKQYNTKNINIDGRNIIILLFRGENLSTKVTDIAGDASVFVYFCVDYLVN